MIMAKRNVIQKSIKEAVTVFDVCPVGEVAADFIKNVVSHMGIVRANIHAYRGNKEED